MKSQRALLFLSWICLASLAWSDEQAVPVLPIEQKPEVEIGEVRITAKIDDRQLALNLNFESKTEQADQSMILALGQIVLEPHDSPLTDYRLDYDPNLNAYRITWPHKGDHHVNVDFMARAEPDSGGPWRQARIEVPFGRVRRIQLLCDQPNLEVELPGAIRVEHQVQDEQLIVTAILGSLRPLIVCWKPQVRLTDAKLVFSSTANTIVDVQAGLLHVDSVFDFQIAQGKIETLLFNVPNDLNVTALDGDHIRKWSLSDATPGLRRLVVEMSRSQEKDYRLRIIGQRPLDKLPTEIEVPAIEPVGGIRAGGFLAIGTNDSLQLVPIESSGLTQIDAAVFPNVPWTSRPRTAGETPATRHVPNNKAFFYTYAGSHYRLRLLADDIVPSYDVVGRYVVMLEEDDLTVEVELELDIRDAPLRQLGVTIPVGMVVAFVGGNHIEDYHASDTMVRVVFAEPVIGRSLVQLRLELGHGPLGQRQMISALQVAGAKSQRGYLLVATEAGIDIQETQVQNLREVHTASVPLRAARTQFAYRFRDADWTLTLTAQSKPAGIRAEVFHLQSIGESLAYGSAVINYVITGSPVDELTFTLPENLNDIEFIGADIRRSDHQDDLWTVKLTRKVIGDYSLAMTCTQRYGPNEPIQLGTLHCRDVQTQTGYIVVTSFLDLKLDVTPNTPVEAGGLMPITRDEVPGDYRLLTHSPILSAYQYVTDSHTATMSIDPYRRSELLPVVLDMATHRTDLAIHSEGRIESATTVRYKVKNTTGQFLSLAMPEGAQVWTVSSIEKGDNGEQVTRLAASHDADTDRLLVPLNRKVNPNDPITIEIQYGQVHQAQGRWRRRLDLAAPGCGAPVAYADWQVRVPRQWAIASAGGNMRVQPRPVSQVGLAHVLGRVSWLWGRALERWIGGAVVWAMGISALAVIVLCVIRFRQRLPELMVILLLIVILWIGIEAVQRGDIDKPVPMISLDYTQAVNADPDLGFQVSPELTPAWRQNVTIADGIGVPAIVILALVVTVLCRRLRWMALSAALTVAVYAAAKIPATWPVLEVLMTWGTPAIISALLFGRVLARHRWSIPVTAAVAVSLIVGGCAGSGTGFGKLAERSRIERIECRMLTGDDSMELQYKLRIAAKGPTDFSLLDDSAVLMSPSDSGSDVTILVNDGRHTIHVDKAGRYDLEATFLAPLAPGREDRQRRFELPLPVSLTNRVTLVVPDVNVAIEVPQAVHLKYQQDDNSASAQAMFAPGQPAVFTWQPKERQVAQEQVRFYASDTALAHVTSGTLQTYHVVSLQIAQGQIDALILDVTGDQTVTNVVAPCLGSWRFDPITHQLEIRLTQPATGAYEFRLVTQSAGVSAPYEISLKPLVVHEALNQQSVMGFSADSSVYFQIDRHPAVMNVRDYVRDAGSLIVAIPGLTAEQVTHAYRFDTAESAITGTVQAVESELRSEETARFNAEDDRLLYNSQWVLEITKAGRFDVTLDVPEGYDIDALEGEPISHWDESSQAGRRHIRVHFKRKLTGSIPLKLTLSRPVTQIPDQLAVPTVRLVDTLKHRGVLLVGSEQGVRLSIASRQGVSEINPAELGHSNQGLLAFRLLRTDWQLNLTAELIDPRITVQSLHVAKVTEGLVRHQHYLRYQLFHAGAKTFDLALPTEAMGMTITGPGIARREEIEPGRWRVELADKVLDQPYLLQVSYETQYNQTNGVVTLAPVRCMEADMQRGHVVVFATDRVELSVDPTGTVLRSAEARSIPKYFGAGELFDAAMCYRITSSDQSLIVRAKRHTAAEQVDADVHRTDITTVVTETGQGIHRVVLILRAGGRRHLQATLPETAMLWSLSVEGQAAQPSIRTNTEGREVLLLPLPQEAAEDVTVEMVYVAELNAGQVDHWSGSHRLIGPRFDLPLKQITWRVYVPEGFMYDDFSGSLTIDKHATVNQGVHRYDLGQYERRIVEVDRANDQLAQQQQSLARELAQQGRQDAARRALAKGYHFSIGNIALNEDIRVDLDNLLQQQAKVGLVNARNRLRRQSAETTGGQAGELITVDGQEVNFSQVQAQRIENSLGQADSRNLEMITRRIMQAQEAAEASVAQLQVTMPVCGKMLQFTSPLQVEPQSAMTVTFEAQRPRLARVDSSLIYGLGFFIGLAVVGSVVGFFRGRWDQLHRALTPTSRQPEPVEATPNNDSDKPDDRVSTEDLV